MRNRDYNSGFRRVLYDAWVLCTSLVEVKQCSYFDGECSDNDELAEEIQAAVESHHMNAMVQIRSMVDFLECNKKRGTDMVVEDFPKCQKQEKLTLTCQQRRSINTFAAHKSWDAIKDDESGGAQRLAKKELVSIGLKVLTGFMRFWNQCLDKNPEIKCKLNTFARRYIEEFNDKWQILRPDDRLHGLNM